MANQRVTLADVAAEAGVSMSSVGNVIHGRPHVREAVRLRVLEAVDKLGYRPLAIGRNLRSGRTGVISLAVPHLAQPYFADIAREVVSQMAGQVAGGGRSLLVQQTENDLEREREVADAWNLGTSDGLLFSPSVISDEEIEERRGAMPLVLLGEHSNLDTVDRVGIDSVAVAHLATSHLLEQGCTRLAMIGHKTFGDPSVVSQREQGFLTALRGSGLEPATYVELGSVHDWTRRDGYSAAQRLLSAGADVDGVFCANDLLALGFLAAAQERGLRVPDDVAVVGIDDIEDAEYSTPTLSTVAIDRHWMVQQSLRLLAQRMEDPDRAPTHTSAPFSLRTRRSTARRS